MKIIDEMGFLAMFTIGVCLIYLTNKSPEVVKKNVINI